MNYFNLITNKFRCDVLLVTFLSASKAVVVIEVSTVPKGSAGSGGSNLIPRWIVAFTGYKYFW